MCVYVCVCVWRACVFVCVNNILFPSLDDLAVDGT